MLVIVSDLHLTDGTTNENISADAFRLLVGRLRDLAERASYRADGAYRPVESINLLLLGDIFDHLHSTRWLDETPGQPGFARPWDDPRTSALPAKIADITDSILQHNADSLAIFKKMSTGQAISVPVASSTGGRFSRRQPVPVHIFYMAGNHDWYFHLPSPAYDAIRQKVVSAAGLSNTPRPFPHTLSESPEIESICQAHRVYAQHGDIYDSLNYDKTKGRDAATLGDAIGIELINRYPVEIRRQLGSVLPIGFIAALGEIINVRPVLLAPVWIESLLKHYAVQPAQAQQVKNIWDTLSDEFLTNPFVRSLDKPLSPDKVDVLEVALKLTKKASIQRISDITKFVSQSLWGGDISFAKHALKEPAFLDHSAHHIIYGHTHHHEIAPLDVYVAGGQPNNQVYLNSGTWHPMHELARHNPNEADFVSQNMLTYLVFFAGDERHGRAYETWSGTLAC